MGHLFKPTFWRLTLSTLKRCHMDWFSLIVIVFNISHLQTSSGARVNSSFCLSVVFFSGGLAFALSRLGLELLFSSCFLSWHFVRVAFLFGPLAPRLPASTAVSLEWQWDSPFNPSFETLGLRWATALADQPPPPDHLENHLIWASFGLMQDVPWAHSRNP
jgi:hypothetical protein